MQDKEAEPVQRLRTELMRRVVRGAGVSAAVAGVARLLFFVQQLILANVLREEDFGQFAFATMVVGLPAMLVNLRGAEAVIQNKDDRAVRALFDTVFTVQLALAVAMAMILMVGRFWVADLLAKPYLTAMLLPMSLLILTASGGPSAATGPLLLPAALLERRLDFVRARLPELIHVVVSSCVSIALAYRGAGLWSLITGALAGSFVQAAFLWALSRQRPCLRLDRHALAVYLQFAWPLYISYLLSWVYLNADYYFVGRRLGEYELGLYYMAFNISQIPLQARFVLSRVAFPTFSRAGEDRRLLSLFYSQAVRYALVLAGLFCAVGIGLAVPLLKLFLGTRWVPAASALQVLLISTWIRTGFGFNGELLISQGKTRAVLVATAAALLVLVGIGPLLMEQWGIVGMSVAVSLSSFASAAISSMIIGRSLNISYGSIVAPAALCMAIWSVAGLCFAPFLEKAVTICGVASILALGYVVMYSLIFDRDRVVALWRLRRKRAKLTQKNMLENRGE